MGISTYDVDNFDRDVDERIEGWANLGNNWTGLLTEDGNMVSSDVLDIDSAVNPHDHLKPQVTLLGVVQRQQEQITKLHEDMQIIYDRNRGLEKEVNRIKDIIRKTSIVTNNINHSLFIEGDK